VLAEFPLGKGAILVPVQIGGKDYQFFVDTGMSSCVFDSIFAGQMKPVVSSVDMTTTGSSIKVDLFEPPDASLAGINLKESGAAVVMDTTLMKYKVGHDIRGFIGMSFLRRYVLQLDFEAKKGRLLESDGRRHPEWGEDVALGTLRGVPVVMARLGEDLSDTFTVDTGFREGVAVNTEDFDEIVRKRKLPTTEYQAVTASGTVAGRMARFAQVSVGSVTARDVIAEDGHDTLLGMSWLRRYRVTFDFPARRMYLAPRPGAAPADEAPMSGLHVMRMPAGDTVKGVDKGSPAAEAGVQAEDVILTVGGKAAKEVDFDDLYDLLRRDGQRITLTLRRGTEEKTVSFVLKRKI
jgi:predicted aspartyl protease